MGEHQRSPVNYAIKNLTPYRDEKGKFSKNSKLMKIYSHEFVVIGKK